jgi:hypothetical protein
MSTAFSKIFISFRPEGRLGKKRAKDGLKRTGMLAGTRETEKLFRRR